MPDSGPRVFHHGVLLAYHLIKGLSLEKPPWQWALDLAAFSDLQVFPKGVDSPK